MKQIIYDKPKSLLQIRKELEQGKTCKVCGEPLTNMLGKGSNVLCKKHQRDQVEYGGAGKISRPHTFHKEWVCVDCGKDVSVEIDNKYPTLKETSPDLFNRLCRNRVIGDHIIRRADGGLDTKENIQTLCLDCNSDKTILNEDWRKSDTSRIQEV